ncbi:family 43 glycosylhydrolase [Stenotrophomonas sp. NPDC077659]|uniref:family 43 glycosylhydrolase n=1 Tax=Stenotrophomonas sp. NPDC077659 TaxID=3390694 RepID=UPI003D02BBED
MRSTSAQDETIATSAGHNSVIQVPGTDRRYIVYHRRPHGDSARDHRETAIERLQFDAQGHILPVQITHEGVAADPLR